MDPLKNRWPKRKKGDHTRTSMSISVPRCNYGGVFSTIHIKTQGHKNSECRGTPRYGPTCKMCPPKVDQGKAGGERLLIVARSRIRLAVGASSGEKFNISKETIKPSPTQFAGGKK